MARVILSIAFALGMFAGAAMVSCSQPEVPRCAVSSP